MNIFFKKFQNRKNIDSRRKNFHFARTGVDWSPPWPDIQLFVYFHTPFIGYDTVHLLGHSMGGKIASVFAVDPTLQRKLASLIIEDVSPVHVSKNSSFRKYVQAKKNVDLSKSRKEIGDQLAHAVPDKPTRDFLLTNLVYDESKPGHMSWKINLDTLDKELDHILEFGLTKGSFSGRTLFISGQNSNYITEKDHPEILKFFPTAKFQIIPKAGHWVHAEQPALFIDAIVKFLLEK
jgi:pimeloyl-ACP methyl ester carboxylesterase